MNQKIWTGRDEEKRKCLQWLREPLINPETGHAIDRDGPTYKSWQQRCKQIGLPHKPTATGEMSWRKYREWKKKPEVNPETGRKIKIDGPTYKKLEKKCKNPEIKEKKVLLLGEWYIPDIDGMIPTIKNRDTVYAVRKYDGRNVWGPLNKHAKNVKLRFYADTWDYHYNHFKPIFLGRKPVRPKIRKIESKKVAPQKRVDTFLNLLLK